MKSNIVLIKYLEEKLSEAFKKISPKLDDNTFSLEITRSTHDRFGHYQCNSAMKLAKVLGMPPREIARQAVENLQASLEAGTIDKIEIAGPGFINLTLSKIFINYYCQGMTSSLKQNTDNVLTKKIVIDFPSVNAAKEMHVGHLRSSIIGDCLARLFEYLGYEVVRLNHIGDWGTAFGMLIAYIKQYDPMVLTGDKAADLTLLVNYYKAAKKLFDDNPSFKKDAQLAVVSLQGGEKNSLKAWEMICEISRKAHQEIYDLLDLRVIERGESFYHPFLATIIQDLENKNLITVSDGAKCLFLEGFVNRDGESLPFILQKSDGGYNYSTTDLAAIYHRIEVEKAQRIIYVVDAGQSIHFAMLFKAAEKAGYLDPHKVKAEHVAFGVVLGPDGKKFKTRSGETERLIDLLNTAINKAEEILLTRAKESSAPFSNDEIKSIARVLGINAVKYADLSGNRINDYTFSYDRMLKFEGNTAAFLMYSYVRIQGIKRKVKQYADAPIQLEHPSEVALGLHICQFEETLLSISEDLMPNRLCDYLFSLAELFNAFFRDCRVEGAPEQNPRLALCELTAKVLKTGMEILGLKVVTKM